MTTLTVLPKMRAQSRRRVCVGCSVQIKGKIRRGKCEPCYRSRRGIPHRPSRHRVSPGELVLANIEVAPDGCWLYTGRVDREGYGKAPAVKGYSQQRAHRAAYVRAVGPLPRTVHLDHTCHSNDPTCPGGVTCKHRRCVNPAHLEPVSPRVNNERSNSRSAINARKTHCLNGHKFTPGDTRLRKRGGSTRRECRQCARDQQRERRRRRRQAQGD
ncbi:hypothetical protein ACFU93_32380 [Streptomyces sp. NPDC057611]|uniref:hypothetical protein n=1 Tax=Streptomyces sp. NPDC057611 TaxID=3346182 RepID=UPI003699D45F